MQLITLLLLYVLYWFLGLLVAIGVCGSFGLLIAAIIAILKTFVRAPNIVFALCYLIGACLVAGLTWCILPLCGWIGDHTDYKGQIGLLVGLIVPGLGSLKIIREFALIGHRQTSGKFE